tara:strand:+ start:159 stop:3134 length:2976 start_codon:yes stop_codon:yes gene_type:complete
MVIRKFNNDPIRDKNIKNIFKLTKNITESIKLEEKEYIKENNIGEKYLNNIENLLSEIKIKNELKIYFIRNSNINEKEFKYLINNTNIDYSNTPKPILSQPSFISDEIIRKIKNYNEKNGTEYGFNISDIFALEEKPKKKKGDCKYLPKFQLEKSEDGRELLINILKMIEDSDDYMNKNTIMKIAENIQFTYGSRHSKVEHPLLILIFLPMGQSINILQKTLMRFIKDNKLFQKFHYCASCSNYKSDEDGDKKFIDFVDKEMEKTKINKKRGCFLFLGDQGRIGITYPDCDITISLDNGQEISKIKQTYYRSLTEANGKTIGINFDMNIQRVYSYTSYVIREYKKNNNDNRSYKEILQYLYEIEQFIFNPDEIGFGNSKELVIEYFEKYEEKLKSEISSDTVLENIMCNDNLGEYITQLHLKNGKTINSKLEGVKQDCPEGGKKKTKVDPITDDNNDDVNSNIKTDEIDDNPFFNINKTKRLYQFMTSLICLLLRKDKINPDNKYKSNPELLDIIKTNEFYKKLLLKKINDNFKISENYLNKIIDKYIEDMTSESNEYILDEIFEIYARSSPEDLRKVIEKHFIPSDEQRKNRAEIPTPVDCVDEMLDKIPKEYWGKIHKTLEPCCGKGNFVLAIFERYFEGLSHIENEIERCKVIIEECIYFCDLDEMNVYITKELLICHAISKINKDYWNDWDKVLEIINFKYNTYIGDTLELDIKNEWGLDYMNAVIFNPPYNNEGGISKGGKNLYNKFIIKSFNILKDDGYSLFIVPTGCLKTTDGKKTDVMNYILNNEIIHININECAKYFNVSSTFVYILIKNNKNKCINSVLSNIKGKIYNSNNINNFKLNFIPLLCDNNTLNIINKCSYNNLNIRRVDSSDKFIYDKFIYMKRLDHINHNKPYLKVSIGDKDLKINGPILYTTYNLNVKKILESKLYAFLNIVTRYDGVIYHNFINMYGYPNIDGIEINNEEDIYKLFKLSNEEVIHIEEILN